MTHRYKNYINLKAFSYPKKGTLGSCVPTEEECARILAYACELEKLLGELEANGNMIDAKVRETIEASLDRIMFDNLPVGFPSGIIGSPEKKRIAELERQLIEMRKAWEDSLDIIDTAWSQSFYDSVSVDKALTLAVGMLASLPAGKETKP